MSESKKPGLLLIGAGQVLTSMIVSGFLLGYLLDLYLGTQPIFILILGGLGFIGGFLKVYRLLTDPELQ
ncbi:MAG: AtpZ/AtpI family protein [Gammaproteobacteria bacterium]|nr:AtpZ/AtpI family protein [Gammaproteobacteria bacterium]MCF6364364.1 AtpZ/AtpI family protein [Gammaproteobacteria bacterium]